jgi:DNA primase
MSDQVQQIKDRLNIVDVVGQYVKLTKAGKNYKGLSPFGNEKTPSFFVSPDKGMYYDFSSGQGGDVFSFIQKMEGLDFKGSLQLLAEKAGIQLQHENKGSRDAREKLYLVLEETTRFFETKLSENKDALEYLSGRGLEESTMRSFRLGFAPNEWQALEEHLLKVGYTEREIEQAGLIKKGENGRYYDRFRSRIMFPIMDTAGRVVAFSGRIFGEPAKDEKNAKYINSPETQLFDKSRILYGYNKAKQPIRKYDFSILVEGQMDLVMSHQAGYANTVATSGTGLTSDHLALLDRLSKKLVMAFDADPAGVASNGRAATLALVRGMDVKVAKIPLGKDPADCIREDLQRWKDAVRTSKHVVDFYIDVALAEGKEKKWEQRQLILHARDTVLPYIQRIRSATDRAQFVRSYANIFGIAEDAVWDELRTMDSSLPKTEPTTPQEYTPTPVQNAPKEKFSRKSDLERALAGFLFWQETLEPKVLEVEFIENKVKDFMLPVPGILAKYHEQKETLVYQAEIVYETHQKPHDILHNLMKDLAVIYTSEELEAIALEQRKAERDNDTAKKEELDTRAYELSKFKSTLE